jgi:hypothetical protein
VLVVCVGLVLLVGVGGRQLPTHRRAVGFALATGVCIAAYTVADGLGVRRAGGALGYIAWLFLVEGCRCRCTRRPGAGGACGARCGPTSPAAWSAGCCR